MSLCELVPHALDQGLPPSTWATVWARHNLPARPCSTGLEPTRSGAAGHWHLARRRLAGERMGTQITGRRVVETAGWYQDPVGRHQFRYWDTLWTEHVADNGVAGVDRLPFPPAMVEGRPAE